MKKLVKFLALLFALTAASGLFACAPKGSVVEFFYFNSVIHIETHQTTLEQSTVDKLDALFLSLENSFDCDKQGSFTNRFNAANGGEEVSLSQTEKTVLTLCSSFYLFTDNLFNPALLPLSTLWQFAPDYPVLNFTPPTDAQIEQVLNSGAIDFGRVCSSIGENSVVKPSGINLDFGGIVKGYAADQAAKILQADGHTAGYVDVGGSSLYLLSVPSLGVRHPDKSGNILSVNLEGQTNLAVSTSGDYEKYYVYQEKTYSHLIDPRTGYPVDTGIRSATIIGAPGAFADAVTTAMCACKHVIGTNENSELLLLTDRVLEIYPDAKIYVVFDDGENKQLLTNEKQGEDFTLLDQSYSIVSL